MKVKDIIPSGQLQWPRKQWAEMEPNKDSFVIKESQSLGPRHYHLSFTVMRDTLKFHCDFPLDVVKVVMERPA
jgi:hypothetical protein